ncbi:type I restriction endonuclease subunit R [Luteibaculum oceani]|uniref:Type I restriction endonuclease subunit R n=1 Tax=Luteibaculum oceani TaxID=1294296 RepID=A0A5C6V293_9FLAO|nr:DEAD/DEAH box helicase family protein [Luteibaculum oceani]TXC78771.1 type I restriction endonuclease subunit R [Luteibaculum oceani]
MIHSEATFESAIEESLLSNGGYVKGYSDDYNPSLGLFPSYVTNFLRITQPKEWEKSVKFHGANVEQKVVERLVKELDAKGALNVLRYGFKDLGAKYKMAFFKPETGLNPENEQLYHQNHLSVTRQLYYQIEGMNSLDLVIALNGIPVSTLELKNEFTGQSVENAKKQYAYDRKPTEPIFQFKKRALVHFAVDTTEVAMTTKLEGKNTFYLPFNLGRGTGAGNPDNPNGYKTAYLWEQVLVKDSLMDLISKFLHLKVEEFELNGVTKRKETLIFPRYHQLDVVRKLTSDARTNGAGKNYLIQHSAGSGKSNSIAWLSYRLSSLHNNKDQRIFDSVIVVTDRKVLDSQLQNTIYQFEHKDGVVQKIDKNSQQLADAITAGTNIIITTLQKFPVILDKIGALPSRNYAVIIDEAHSSQGGEATKKMKEVLTTSSLEEAEEIENIETEDTEDQIRKSMEARGKQANLSFFAFTATPKPKTVEVFGTLNSEGLPMPFHVYSMRQAIEEGFILDVLKNYTTYKTYFGLSEKIKKDREVNKKQASRAIARFLTLHPTNLAQKTEVIIEHFREVVSKKIGGQAKAMVVTASRLHAVRYKLEFDSYIKEKGYKDIKTLVAFSGKVICDGYADGATEVDLNKGIKERELPKKFASPEYQVLLVADKYQTGFDQPLLHTMYVDKKLSGVKCVQTLSRLNRTTKGKEDTFVLDFANEAEDILNSFQPYYEVTTINQTSDPNKLYDLLNRIEDSRVLRLEEIDSFAKVFFKSKDKLTTQDQSKLYSFVDPAVDRFKALPSETEFDDVIPELTQESLKKTFVEFIRSYSFLTQIMPFSDEDLEKYYTYCRFLIKKLPRKKQEDRFQLGDDVSLEYYRIQKVGTQNIALDPQGEFQMENKGESGLGKVDEEYGQLSEIIKSLNTRFGTEFTDADRLFFDQIEAELKDDNALAEQAKSNSIENFKYGFNDKFLEKLIGRMEQNQDIFSKIMDDQNFGNLVKDYFMQRVYRELTAKK